jgi:Flp pilus assembly protein TadD
VCLLATLAGSACAARRPALARTQASSTELERYLASVRRQVSDLGARPASADRVTTLERADRAIGAAQMAVQLAPTAEHHRLLAEAYLRRGVLDAAYDEYTRALGVEPCDAAAFDGRARVWRGWGLPQFGLNDAHRAVYYAPSAPGPLNTLGTLLLSLGQTSEARRAFDLALSRDHSAVYALNNLCFATVLAGDATNAVPVCERAREAQPVAGITRTNLALAHVLAGDLPSALRLMTAPGHSELARVDLADALMAVRQYPAAAALYEQAASDLPGFAPAASRARAARRLAAAAVAADPR